MMDVVNPGKVKTVQELANIVDNCELKVSALEKEREEILNEKIKAALLLGVCMQELQDIIAQRSQHVEQYAKVEEVFMNFIDNRRSQNAPSPMDLGGLNQQRQRQLQHQRQWIENQRQWPENNDGQQYEGEVGMLGQGASWFNCGGQGRFARGCSTPKGNCGNGKGF